MALATVVHVENSSYRRSGARMLIAADGSWTGGISGGCLEGDTLRKAQHSMLEGKPTIVRYDTRDGDPNQIGVGLGCNGLIDVLITPLQTETDGGPVAMLKRCVATRQAHVLITVIRAPNSAVVGKCIFATAADYELPSTIETSAAEALRYAVKQVKFTKKSKAVTIDQQSGTLKFFIEYLPPPIALYICGNNYDIRPLAYIADYIGWTLHLVANPLQVEKDVYELAASVQHPDKELPALDHYSAIVLMAHDLVRDTANLKKALASAAGYIGILGPKKRSDQMLAAMKEESIQTYTADRIFAPVGLDTGATSPEEIAIAIVAEIRAFYSRREGGFLRHRPLPIND